MFLPKHVKLTCPPSKVFKNDTEHLFGKTFNAQLSTEFVTNITLSASLGSI